MNQERRRVSSGVSRLDRLLGGLFIGDNVVWYDDAGSLASLFCLNFIRISQEQEKPFIYVTFDRSPRNLMKKLGPLARNPNLTIVDCFTNGKGAGSNVFLKFYKEHPDALSCRIVRVEAPQDIAEFTKTFYGLFEGTKDDAPFDFDTQAEPYLIEIPPQAQLSSHFFVHKGEEVGYVLMGRLEIHMAKGVYAAQEGDVIYLSRDIPLQWKNPGPHIAKIFWVKIK